VYLKFAVVQCSIGIGQAFILGGRVFPFGITDFGITDFGVTDFGITDFWITDFEITDFGITDFGITDLGFLTKGREYKNKLLHKIFCPPLFFTHDASPKGTPNLTISEE
jgi:hypothetical protein